MLHDHWNSRLLQFIQAIALLLMLNIGIVTSAIGPTPEHDGAGLPKFFASQERSLDGSPQMSITFPDGQTDNLILEKHSANNNHCHYIGHLANERSACVAVTGCLGRDDLDLTIMSQRLNHSPTMRWAKDGSVQVFNTDRKLKVNYGVDDIADKADAEKEGAILYGIEEKCKDGSCEDKIQRTHLLKYRVYYDDHVRAYLHKHENAANIDADENAVEKTRAFLVHTQACLCHSSLGIRVQLKELESPIRLEGIMVHNDTGYKWAGDLSSRLHKEAASENKEMANLVLWLAVHGKDDSDRGTLGRAYRGTVCRSNPYYRWAYGYWSNVMLTGSVFAHEIGHTLGADENYGSKWCKSFKDYFGFRNVMSAASYSIPARLWSSCTRPEIEAYIIQQGDNWCLAKKEDACCYNKDFQDETKNYEYIGCFKGTESNPGQPILLGVNPLGFTAVECHKLASNTIYARTHESGAYEVDGFPFFGVQDLQCYGFNKVDTFGEAGGSCNCGRGAQFKLNSIGVYKVNGLGEINGPDESPDDYMEKQWFPIKHEIANVPDSYLTNPSIKYKGYWGSWGPEKICKTGKATNFWVQTESECKCGDETALNSICLVCSDGEELYSKRGYWGKWHHSATCLEGFTATNFKWQKSLGSYADDTAGNALKLRCGTKNWMTGVDAPELWGEWLGVKACPKGAIICGLKTQVESRDHSDDTSLNGVEFICCAQIKRIKRNKPVPMNTFILY